MIVSVDPGKRNGVAVWAARPQEASLTTKFVATFDEAADFLEELRDVSEYVVEGFRLDDRAARQRGSQLDAAQTIGMVRALARRRGAIFTTQPNTVLNVAAMHAGVQLYKHYPDDISAMLHGYWHLENLGYARSEIVLP